jgi:hypothetical protein
MVKEGPGCWLWLGSTDRLGYGQFSAMAPGKRRRMVRVHRFTPHFTIRGTMGRNAVRRDSMTGEEFEALLR